MNNHNNHNRGRRANADRNPLEQAALDLISRGPVINKDILEERKRRKEHEKQREYFEKSKEYGHCVLRSLADQPRINALVFGVHKNSLDYIRP